MGIKFCKSGNFGGKSYLFTHYNPITHEAWSDEIPIIDKETKKIEYGAWIPYDSIKW